MTMKHLTGCASALVLLAACGGSSGSGATTSDPFFADVASAQPLTPAVLTTIEENYDAAFGDAIRDEDRADPADFQATGTANFVGVIGIGEDPNDGTDSLISDSVIASRMDVDIDLASGALSGTADDFAVVATNSGIGGSVTLTGTLNRIDTDAFGASGDVNGTLTFASGGQAVIDGDLVVDFYGDTGEAFDGDSNGRVTITDADDNPFSSDSFDYDADIIAGRVGITE